MSDRVSSSRISYSLLADCSMVIECDRTASPMLHRWLPLNATQVDPGTVVKATIELGVASTEPRQQMLGKATLKLGAVGVRLDEHTDRAVMQGAGGLTGVVDLGRVHAAIGLGDGIQSDAEQDLYTMLTLASALLLGRMGRALVHAGAVAEPSGGCWLVVGDSRSGKSTTCVSLGLSGFDFISDDQVVLQSDDRGIEVVGWPRPIHLDAGWDGGAPSSERATVLPQDMLFGEWLSHARLVGVILPRVAPDEPTLACEATAADVFTELVRQSPWLIADKVTADSVAEMLTSVALLRHLRLSLGLDSFGRPEVLRERLKQLIG